MGSFNTFKDIRYWILLVPFLIIIFLYIYCTPSDFFEKPYVSSISIFIFRHYFGLPIIYGIILIVKRREKIGEVVANCKGKRIKYPHLTPDGGSCYCRFFVFLLLSLSAAVNGSFASS